MAEPFHPKFADLVRSYTSTTGTGKLVLGEAAPGFRSFSETLQPGDCFYYSVTSLDKVSECEVGRGTLQSDGSIARDPIGGALTDFSKGIKSVALVTAAEWFERAANLDDLSAATQFDAGAPGSVTRQLRAKAGDVLSAKDFGAAGDGITDDTAALQAMSDWFFNDGTIVRDAYADFSGNFAISGKLTIGPTAQFGAQSAHPAFGGDLTLTQLAAGTMETCHLRNLNRTVSTLRVTANGQGGISFASRTCAIGITLENSNRATFAGLRANNFWLQGIHIIGTGTSSSDASLGHIEVVSCGSGYGGANHSLAANWSAPVNSGSSGSAGQRTTIAVDNFPSADLETYCTVGSSPVFVRIAGQEYFVYSWDRGAGTIAVYPWLDNASVSAGSGTLDWIFGGGVFTSGSDANIINIRKLNASKCGIALAETALYGSRVESFNCTTNGIGILFGSQPGNAQIGSSIDAFYPEGNDCDLFYLATTGPNGRNYITSSYALQLSKVRVLASRTTAGALVATEVASGGTGPGDSHTNALLIAADGYIHSVHQRALTNLRTTTATFRDHARPPRLHTQYSNTQTVTIAVVGSGEYNRLFGYRGGTWRYVGTGTNGAPTGTITFVPPSGGKINGGADDAPVAFSGFYGPADFEIFHTDTAQLTWIVRPVAGWNGARQAAAQANSTAPTVAGLVSDFNALLAKLKAAGLMA